MEYLNDIMEEILTLEPLPTLEKESEQDKLFTCPPIERVCLIPKIKQLPLSDYTNPINPRAYPFCFEWLEGMPVYEPVYDFAIKYCPACVRYRLNEGMDVLYLKDEPVRGDFCLSGFAYSRDYRLSTVEEDFPRPPEAIFKTWHQMAKGDCLRLVPEIVQDTVNHLVTQKELDQRLTLFIIDLGVNNPVLIEFLRRLNTVHEKMTLFIRSYPNWAVFNRIFKELSLDIFMCYVFHSYRYMQKEIPAVYRDFFDLAYKELIEMSDITLDFMDNIVLTIQEPAAIERVRLSVAHFTYCQEKYKAKYMAIWPNFIASYQKSFLKQE